MVEPTNNKWPRNVSQREMPRYKCHKEVWALKIKSVENIENVHYINPEDAGFAPFAVDKDYIEKHNPQPGGYFVVYQDGYKSFSPASAFEGGYHLKTEKDLRKNKLSSNELTIILQTVKGWSANHDISIDKLEKAAAEALLARI